MTLLRSGEMGLARATRPSFGGDRQDSFVMTGPGPAGRRRAKLQLMVGLSDTGDPDGICLVIGSGEFALAVVK